MLTRTDMIHFALTEAEIKQAIRRTLEYLSISGRDNLRIRHGNIQFDCLLRGYIGEHAIKKWLMENNIEIEMTNFIEENDQMDVDFLFRGKNIELKTSLIPDQDISIDNALFKRDIKLIKRTEKIEDFKGDIHLQIFFAQKRRAKDQWLKAQKIDIKKEDTDYFYSAFRADRYCHDTYFTGWIDKPSLINHINSLPYNKRTWTFGGSSRLFWNYRMRDCKSPAELINYLQALQ